VILTRVAINILKPECYLSYSCRQGRNEIYEIYTILATAQ
jgi:hypothetical protein